MEDAPGISYNITYQPTYENVMAQALTHSTTKELSPLSSGTRYTITVVTIGPQNLKSTAVNASSYTRKYNREQGGTKGQRCVSDITAVFV